MDVVSGSITFAEGAQEFGLLEQVERVSRLDLSGKNFRELQKLSAFFNLNELILDKNQLDDRDFDTLPCFPRLKSLSVNKNEIANLDRLLETLQRCCPSLTYLSLLGNPVCPDQLSGEEETEDDYRCYRLYVLYKLPKLNALDSSMFRNIDREEASRQGPFLKTVRPSMRANLPNFDGPVENFKPLPKTSSKSSHASFGKKRHTYSGKFSEGNRFIRNKDL